MALLEQGVDPYFNICGQEMITPPLHGRYGVTRGSFIGIGADYCFAFPCTPSYTAGSPVVMTSEKDSANQRDRQP